MSRVVDIHDRDSMIYSDGAGATIIEATDEAGGILSHESATYAYDEADYLFLEILTIQRTIQMFVISKCLDEKFMNLR